VFAISIVRDGCRTGWISSWTGAATVCLLLAVLHTHTHTADRVGTWLCSLFRGAQVIGPWERIEDELFFPLFFFSSLLLGGFREMKSVEQPPPLERSLFVAGGHDIRAHPVLRSFPSPSFPSSISTG